MTGMVLVDGATGYLGNHLVAKLKSEGFPVRCLVHERSNEHDIEFLKGIVDDIQVVNFNEISEENSKHIFEDVFCLVHLIGSIAPKKGETLSQLHRELTSRLVNCGQKNGLEKIVHVTALGASPNAESTYHKTKWLAEEVVKNSGIQYKILRPSLIIGRVVGSKDSKLVKRLLKFIKTRPFVPLINGGFNKVQPIFVSDVVDAIIAAIKSKDGSEICELGGAKQIEMRELVQILAKHLDKSTKVMALPDSIGGVLAGFMEKVQDVPLLSRDQVVLSLTDNVCQANAFEELVGRPPIPLDRVITTYEESYLESL